MSRRIHTITGIGASTSTSAANPAQVVWGPNFGSTRQFAEDESLSGKSDFGSTVLLIEDELVRLTGADQNYRIIEESSVKLSQQVGYRPLIDEGALTRNVFAQNAGSFTEEETCTAYSHVLGYPMREEELVRPSSYETTYPAVLKHEGRFATQQQQSFDMVDEGAAMLYAQVPTYRVSTCEETMGVPAIALGIDRQILEDEVGRLTQVTYTNNNGPNQEGDFVLAQILLFFSSSGSFTQPLGTSLYDGNIWAAGGGGGTGGGVGGGNGGGGGGQSFSSGLIATPGTTVTVTIGPASTGNGLKSWIGSSVNLLARPGTRGGDGGGSTGLGGTTATAVGQLKFKGGNGSTGIGAQGGGGGGGAGTLNPGSNSASTAGGAGGLVSGGAGGRGGNAAAAGGAGVIVGGGGGGGGNLTTGASGARGAAAVTIYLPV